MVSLRSIATTLLSIASILPSTHAHSVDRNPLSYISLLHDPDIRTHAHKVHAHSNFDLTFSLHDHSTEIRLLLEPNTDILSHDFSVTRLSQDGKPKHVQSVERHRHKVYRGKAFVRRETRSGWHEAGWARIMMHRDGPSPMFDGTFRVDSELHHIQRGEQYQKTRQRHDPELPRGDENVMVVWRNSDIMPFNPADDEEAHLELKRHLSDSQSCTADSLEFNRRDDAIDYRDLRSVNTRSLFGRQVVDDGDAGGDGRGAALINTIGSTTGCPNTRKVALVGIATDCTYFQEFDGDEENLRRHVIGMVNQASEVYESTFNISLGIANLTIIDADCPASPQQATPWNVDCDSGVDISERLSRFSEWRGKLSDNNAYWSLLTTCATNSAVGLAWRRQLCRQGSGPSGQANETVASTNVVVKKSSEWQIFAHETGHTFGAYHDCTDQTCPTSSDMQQCCPLSRTSCDAEGEFLMNPSTSDSHTRFSPCSIGNICTVLRMDTGATCLTDNRNVNTVTGAQCGNGIVESGEDCDCGGEDGCGDNNCCDAKTCKFKGSAVCDPSNEDCCTGSCQFASNGTVCRASTSDCDPEEKCPGDKARCPQDEHADDGDDCGDGLECASGQCTSRDLQCQIVVGETTANNNTEACPFEENTCQVTCSDPRGGCVSYRQNFLDGTPCGSGGRCQDGTCEGSSTLSEVAQWFKDNKDILIPVGAVLGGLLALAILSCMFKSCRRRSRMSKRAKLVSPSPPMGDAGGVWRGNNFGPGHNNMSGGNGAAFAPPPPTYSRNDTWGSQGQGGWGQPQPFGYQNRTMSARYA